MPRQCVCGPPWQALTVEQIAALLGAANPSSPTSLSVAAFIAKNVVNGNRAAQEWLLQWNEVARAERGGVMVGVTTSVGLTKTDRLQMGKTKPLQCCSECTGKVELNADGSLNVCKLCPAHLLEASREKWAEELDVSVEDVQGAVFADMVRFDDVGKHVLQPGDTLVARNEDSPAYSARPKAPVLIITKAQEAAGRRYRGDEDLRDGEGKVCRPRMGRLFFELEGASIATSVWCDAKRAAARMRVLAIAANKQAKRAGSTLPFGNIFACKGFRDFLSTRSLRRTMATGSVRGNVPLALTMKNGEWDKPATTLKYVDDADPFATMGVNLTDVIVHGKSAGASSEGEVLLQQVANKDAEIARLTEENARAHTLLELHGMSTNVHSGRMLTGSTAAAILSAEPARLQSVLSAQGGRDDGGGGHAGRLVPMVQARAPAAAGEVSRQPSRQPVQVVVAQPMSPAAAQLAAEADRTHAEEYERLAAKRKQRRSRHVHSRTVLQRRWKRH